MSPVVEIDDLARVAGLRFLQVIAEGEPYDADRAVLLPSRVVQLRQLPLVHEGREIAFFVPLQFRSRAVS